MELALAEQAKIGNQEPTIVELQRKKDLEETKFRYFSSSLEQARFDEALGAGKNFQYQRGPRLRLRLTAT